jgi:CRISPR/Cas system-associated exonuclease Cas4 (RecB family)
VQSYFERTLTTEESVESAWKKLRGTLLHYAGRSFGWSELRVKTAFELDGRIITILGHVDAYDPDTATIYELKTTRFVNWQHEKGFIPRENHVAQIQCYSTLLDNYGIPVDRLILVYLDDQNILPEQVPLGSRKVWMVQRATLLHRALQNSKICEPETGVGCRYCSFVTVCPKSDVAARFKEGTS